MNQKKFVSIFIVSLFLILSLSLFAQAKIDLTSGLTNNQIIFNVDYEELQDKDKSLVLTPISLTFKNSEIN